MTNIIFWPQSQNLQVSGFTPKTQTRQHACSSRWPLLLFVVPSELQFYNLRRLPLLTAGGFEIKDLAHFIVRGLLLPLVSDPSERRAHQGRGLHPCVAASPPPEKLFPQQKQTHQNGRLFRNHIAMTCVMLRLGKQPCSHDNRFNRPQKSQNKNT